jgi:hypothetical protein
MSDIFAIQKKYCQFYTYIIIGTKLDLSKKSLKNKPNKI